MKFVKNRIDDILPLVKGKRVLEMGCVGMGDDDSIGGENFIHDKIVKESEYCVGLDINEKGLKELSNMGYNVQLQNIEERFNLGEKFDVVFLEEVIEHINNPGICLENVIRHLKVGGTLIFTTPNAHALTFFAQRLLRDEISGVATEEHTHWHDINTIKTLFKRYNIEVEEFYYVQPLPIEETWKYKIIKFVWSFFPDRVGRNIVCICKYSSQNINNASLGGKDE